MRHTLILTALTLLPLAACTPHARYPDVRGDVVTADLNIMPSPVVMRLALQRVGGRHLSGVRPYAVDFPPVVDEDVARAIADKMGDHVSVAWDAPQGAPVIEISRVWILGDQAQVDVRRPVEGLGHQLLTVRLRADIRGWRVDGVRSWPVGFELENVPVITPEEDLDFDEVPADEAAPTPGETSE
jgi:hypothetical protein